MVAKKITENMLIKNIDKKEHNLFLKEGHVFLLEKNSKWLINFNKIPELIKDGFAQYMKFINENYEKYENWFNKSFNER